MVIPLWPLVIQNRPVYQLRWGVSKPIQWTIDNIYIGKFRETYKATILFTYGITYFNLGNGCPHYCQGVGYCDTLGK